MGRIKEPWTLYQRKHQFSSTIVPPKKESTNQKKREERRTKSYIQNMNSRTNSGKKKKQERENRDYTEIMRKKSWSTVENQDPPTANGFIKILSKC